MTSKLRDSLPTRPDETGRILAEAEDHLREAAAAGLAAGLTETEAVDATISSFGSVQAVARAHESPRGRAAAFSSRPGCLTRRPPPAESPWTTGASASHPLRQVGIVGLLAVATASGIRVYGAAHRQHGTQ